MPPVPTSAERAKPARKAAARSRSENGSSPLTDAQLARLVAALEAARDGDFSVRMRAEGPLKEVAAAFNALVERNQLVTKEFTRISKVVGREGRINERANAAGAPGSWSDKIGAVNELIDNLARPTIEVARVIDAVAEGDLTQRIQLEIAGQPVRGEFRRIGTTVNGMVDQLSSFAAEVTRVAREVGTEGKLGGQAKVKGVSGTWNDLTDSVNQMASNLTGQVRNIAEVTTAVANGDLSKKVTVDVKGEVLELKNTVNTMVDQLSSFADEVTRVAREVGTDGKLGGQAQVKGVSGVWKDLTDNVNTLAGNLTSQVRNIAAVTTAVATGDLSKKITVDVQRRGARAEGDHQHDGRPAAVVLGRGDARREGGRHRGQARRPGAGRRRLRRLEGPDREREHARRQPHRPGAEHRRGDDRRREGRPLEEDHRRGSRRGARGEGDRQHDGRPAALVRRRGHPRRARGRHRGPARRPGDGRGRLRRVEGPDRQRQHARRQPHLAGAQHRARHDGGRERRPLEEDHRRRQGRDPRAQGHDQHDGRPAVGVRRRGDARRPRGRHRGPPRRPGAGRGRLRDLARPDREREHAREQPHRPGAEHRRGDDRRRRGRPLEEDHRRREGRGARAEVDDQHDGRPALRVRRPR